MTIEIEGKTYYRTSEACARLGVSESTLLRWFKSGRLPEVHRDGRGWKMFTKDDLKAIRTQIWRLESLEDE